MVINKNQLKLAVHLVVNFFDRPCLGLVRISRISRTFDDSQGFDLNSDTNYFAYINQIGMIFF